MAQLGIALALLVFGCSSISLPRPSITPAGSRSVSSPSVTPAAASSGPIEHPIGATDVVLRMGRSGGFLYPGTTIDEPPTFTLYGDGRVIYTVGNALPSGGTRRELRHAQLNEEQVSALLQNALGAGGLAQARDRYADVPMADGTTTNFEINAEGVHKTVSVYALGEFDEPGPDADARAAFEALAAVLREFGAEVATGDATDLGTFEPEAYRLSIFPDVAGELASTADWPWPDLEPSDFPRDNSGFGRLVGTPAQGKLVAGLPAGEIGDPIVIGPDGVNYVVRARPLLPDEEP